MQQIIETIIWAAVIQGFLLGIVFIFSRKYRSFANRLLGFFLITFVFEALSALLPFDAIGSYSISGAFTLPVVQIFLPILFLHFVVEKMGRSSSYHLFITLHYWLAFSIVSITAVNVFLFFFAGNQIVYYTGWEFAERIYLGQQYYAFMLALVMLILVVRETLRYREMVRNEYSDYSLLEIGWLWQCIFVLVPIVILWGAELLRIFLGGIGQSQVVIVTWALISIFLYFVSYKAFLHPNLFDSSEAVHPGLENVSMDREGSNAAVDEKLCVKIVSGMEQGEHYLDQDLTLHEFAKAIDVSPRLVSSCINQTLQINFNEWVNGYRVDKVISLLQDEKSEQFSIAGLGSDAGFKSRSAMYMAFKKKTGQSPGYFRQT